MSQEQAENARLPMTAQDVVEWFNETHSLGTSVTYWPGAKAGPAREGQTRTPAWVLGGTPVVSITGYAGGIALTHVVCAAHPFHAQES